MIYFKELTIFKKKKKKKKLIYFFFLYDITDNIFSLLNIILINFIDIYSI